MTTTRRDLLSGLALGAGAGAVPALWPLRAAAQNADAAATAAIRADLERHAGFGDKFSGGPGDLATATWIAARLRRSGYRVEESEFPAPFFVERTARLSTGVTAVDVVPQAPVVTTGAGGVTAPLALVDGEDVGDVRGRIVLFLTPFARHAALFATRGIGKTVTAAANAGARAVVIVTRGPSGEAVALNAPQEPFVPVPTAVLAPKLADPLIDAAKAGATARLILDGGVTHRPSKNIVARVERGDKWLAISTPRSGWYGCVGERGTGTAVFLQLADWAVRRFPDLSVFMMNTGGHEYFFAGSERVVDEAPPAADTLVWAHIGATLAARDAEERRGKLVLLDTADPQRTLMVTDSARVAAADSFRGLSGLSDPVAVRPQAGELSSFTDRGYTAAFAVIGVHRWFHTTEDTLATVEASLVTPVLRAHQRTIERLVGRA